MPDRIPALPPALRPGAIVYGPGYPVDALLGDFALTLARRGFRVGGVVQRNTGAGENCAALMELVDIAAGQAINITQKLGTGSTSCRVDPTGVAEASVVVRRAVEERVDLLVVNKFSTLEKNGGGLADELMLALSEGIPVLTCVGGRHLADWHRFTGGMSDLLSPEPAALWRWWGGHRLYQDLPLAVTDRPVRRVVCGGTYVMVEATGGGHCGVGLARLPRPMPAPDAAMLAGYAARGLGALAGLTTSWDPFETTLAIAAINAAVNRPEPPPGCIAGEPANGLDVFGSGAATGRLVVIGAFPGIARRLPGALVTDIDPEPGQYPAEASDWLLPGCDAAVITASALPNRTLPRLLDRTRGARVALIGPGTPLSPRLFDYGIEILAGLIVEDADGMAGAVARDDPPEQFKNHGRRVALRRA